MLFHSGTDISRPTCLTPQASFDRATASLFFFAREAGLPADLPFFRAGWAGSPNSRSSNSAFIP